MPTTIDTISLPAQSSRQIDYADLSGDAKLQNSFVVTSDGAPGDIGAKLFASGNSQLDDVELLGKDQMDSDNGGNHPWSLQSGTASTLLLFNSTSSPQYFNVSIATNTGALWQKAYQLKSMETKALSIGDLVQTRAQDDKGRTLPTGAANGQIGWYTANPYKGTGRLLQANADAGMARSFSCGQNIELCGATFSGVTQIVDGQEIDFGTINTQVCMNSCSGTPVGSGGSGYSYLWGSQNSSIVSTSGSTSNASINVYGSSVGSTYLNGSVFSGSCQASTTPPAQVVACPTSVSVRSNTPISITDNTSLHTGYGDMVSMSVSPTSSNSSSYSIVESVTPQTNSCPFVVFPTVAQGATGTFNVGSAAVLDDNSNVVYSAVPNAFYDELSVKDTKSDLPTSTASCTATASHSYYCAGKLLGTFTDTTTITQGTANGGPASIVSTTQK